MKIMIIDDSSVMRKIILKSLRQAGYVVSDVKEGANGKEGLEILSEIKSGDELDLILTDLNMPDMNGYEFTKSVRERGINTPILLITSEGSQTKMDEAKKLGVNGHLQKPPRPEELREKIDEIMGLTS